MGRLDGKVSVITGGASGMGAGTVRRFVAEGAKVVIADILDDKAKALVEELGEPVLYARTDVSQEDQVAAAVDMAVGSWGRLDCMFNNAGLVGVDENLEDLPVEGIDQTLDVLKEGRGNQFDPHIIDTFLGIIPEALEIIEKYPDPVD